MLLKVPFILCISSDKSNGIRFACTYDKLLRYTIFYWFYETLTYVISVTWVPSKLVIDWLIESYRLILLLEFKSETFYVPMHSIFLYVAIGIMLMGMVTFPFSVLCMIRVRRFWKNALDEELVWRFWIQNLFVVWKCELRVIGLTSNAELGKRISGTTVNKTIIQKEWRNEICIGS